MKIFSAFLLLLFWITSPNLATGQDYTLEELKRDVALLKRVVDEQDRRLKALEKEASELKGIKPTSLSERKISKPTIKSGEWKVASNWDRVKNGMSEMQVFSILGKPTSVDISVSGIFRTLFYRGEVPDSGFVSGNIKLNEDRVWMINKPVF